MQKRERAWMIGSVAIYIMLSALLLYLLNPQTDRQGREQARVFFTASHVIVAMAVGYGLSLIGATLALHYQRFRQVAWISAALATGIFFYNFETLKSQYRLDQLNAMFVVVLAAAPREEAAHGGSRSCCQRAARSRDPPRRTRRPRGCPAHRRWS